MADKKQEETKKAEPQPKVEKTQEQKSREFPPKPEKDSPESKFREQNPVAGGPDVGQTPASERGMSHS